MTTHDRVRLQLQTLEALLREHQHWRNDEPQPHQFNSTQPFLYGHHGTTGVVAVGADPANARFVR